MNSINQEDNENIFLSSEDFKKLVTTSGPKFKILTACNATVFSAKPGKETKKTEGFLCITKDQEFGFIIFSLYNKIDSQLIWIRNVPEKKEECIIMEDDFHLYQLDSSLFVFRFEKDEGKTFKSVIFTIIEEKNNSPSMPNEDVHEKTKPKSGGRKLKKKIIAAPQNFRHLYHLGYQNKEWNEKKIPHEEKEEDETETFNTLRLDEHLADKTSFLKNYSKDDNREKLAECETSQLHANQPTDQQPRPLSSFSHAFKGSKIPELSLRNNRLTTAPAYHPKMNQIPPPPPPPRLRYSALRPPPPPPPPLRNAELKTAENAPVTSKETVKKYYLNEENKGDTDEDSKMVEIQTRPLSLQNNSDIITDKKWKSMRATFHSYPNTKILSHPQRLLQSPSTPPPPPPALPTPLPMKRSSAEKEKTSTEKENKELETAQPNDSSSSDKSDSPSESKPVPAPRRIAKS